MAFVDASSFGSAYRRKPQEALNMEPEPSPVFMGAASTIPPPPTQPAPSAFSPSYPQAGVASPPAGASQSGMTAATMGGTGGMSGGTEEGGSRGMALAGFSAAMQPEPGGGFEPFVGEGLNPRLGTRNSRVLRGLVESGVRY